MLKKCFILTQFGEPHYWTENYFKNVQMLEKYGYYWKIFTPNNWQSQGNVEIIPMNIEEFNSLIEKNCGVNPHNKLNPFPTKPVSDFYVASGDIFKDYLEGFDFWGITNWDVVYGRLDHFLSDEELETCDIWSDDRNTINGVFTLVRNEKYPNTVYMDIPEWQRKFTEHRLFGLDEIELTDVVRKLSIEGKLRFKYPPYYPLHSYDRLAQHVPVPEIEFQDDGSLWERFYDVNPPRNDLHFRNGYRAREIMYFHFNHTKRYPLI